ncbi:MAG TPA: DUF4290 domain-containing protein [Flavobacterium sp.]|nr:DUF4290 domain-containing protein [Flavobacterium sp.]
MAERYHPENAHDVVHHLEYNAEREPLFIPEYGRILQKLIMQAVEVADRDERNRLARYIIQVMGNMNPHLRDVPDFQHKLWDQIFIMSDFKLDVDSPYPRPTAEVLQLRPDPLPYPQHFPKYRYYGNNIQYMIDAALQWEDGEMKSALAIAIANHMKKMYLSWNKETVTDEVIFQHLHELSGGRLDLQGTEELVETAELIKTNRRMSNSKKPPTQQTNNNQKKNNKKNQYKKKQ